MSRSSKVALACYLNSRRGHYYTAKLTPEDVRRIFVDDRYRLWIQELPPPSHRRLLAALTAGNGCHISLPRSMSDVIDE
ncbi:MAG: hypothetical protein OXC31_26665 [Spirochaetaceae bacterium]|nr:hypothetical protein [Spirochaetaceae bacterium]